MSLTVVKELRMARIIITTDDRANWLLRRGNLLSGKSLSLD